MNTFLKRKECNHLASVTPHVIEDNPSLTGKYLCLIKLRKMVRYFSFSIKTNPSQLYICEYKLSDLCDCPD